MNVLTKKEMKAHNAKVIKNVLVALVENHLADPSRLLTDSEYAAERISYYMEAANIVREMMNMPKLYLYEI